MKSSTNKLWFSLLHKRPYIGNEPNFENVADFKGIKELELNYNLVLNELQNYLKQNTFESQFNTTMVEKPKSWKVRALRVWGVEMYEIQKYFPETLKLLSNIDGVINVGFNLLEPQAKIKAHCGDTNAIIRCHLGLIIPKEKQACAIKVNGEIQNWDLAKTLSFTDAYEHEAWNISNEQRVIMLFDILKPNFITKKNKICGVTIASLYMQRFGNWFPFMYRINPIWMWPISLPLSFLIRLMIPIRNKLRKN